MEGGKRHSDPAHTSPGVTCWPQGSLHVNLKPWDGGLAPGSRPTSAAGGRCLPFSGPFASPAGHGAKRENSSGLTARALGTEQPCLRLEQCFLLALQIPVTPETAAVGSASLILPGSSASSPLLGFPFPPPPPRVSSGCRPSEGTRVGAGRGGAEMLQAGRGRASKSEGGSGPDQGTGAGSPSHSPAASGPARWFGAERRHPHTHHGGRFRRDGHAAVGSGCAPGLFSFHATQCV